MKRSYFRLLLQGFLTPMNGHKTSMDINHERFLKVMKYVVQFDLENGYNFYSGLVVEESMTGSVTIGNEVINIDTVKEKL